MGSFVGSFSCCLGSIFNIRNNVANCGGHSVNHGAGCSRFSDYLDLYLKTDVMLLAEVFEAFRAMCMSNYGLDPCHYFTLPGFACHGMPC